MAKSKRRMEKDWFRSLRTIRHSLFAIRYSLFNYSMIISGSPNSTGCASSTRICTTRPARARLRPEVGGADHRRGHRAGMFRHVAGRRVGCGGRDGRAAWRRNGGGDDRLALARDPYPYAAALELDLGEIGLVQKLRELADHVLIDGRAFGLVAGFFRPACHA
jgi:hypothetical protein